MSCANASATKPFGAIDTPEQGGVATGGAFVNFGWALTPLPKTIPTDGSSITVLVDGVPVGTADYNHARPDIAGLFPGLNNTNGAIGFRVLDTTALTNGTHTIVWVVSDNQGAAEGIGSRFFTVSNGAGALTAARAPAPTDERRMSVRRPERVPALRSARLGPERPSPDVRTGCERPRDRAQRGSESSRAARGGDSRVHADERGTGAPADRIAHRRVHGRLYVGARGRVRRVVPTSSSSTWMVQRVTCGLCWRRKAAGASVRRS